MEKTQNFGNDEATCQETERETDEQFAKRMRKNYNNRYPVVMKNKDSGRLLIIYRNRVEWFDLSKKETKSELDVEFADTEDGEWNPYIEIEMAQGNGYKRVNDTTEEDDWRFEDGN